MPIKLNLNWCRGGRGKKGEDADSHMRDQENAHTEPNIKRLEELANFYQVDWSRETGFIGRGNFAEVFRGVDIRSGNRVAVKNISRKNQDVKTLRQEIAALLKVNGHPNIVRLYDVFIDPDHVVLVMELLEGGELFSRVVHSGAYTEREASKHFKRITEALLFMHQHGIVHRDLKPENLVLATADPDSEIKISDFGLSKVLGEDQNMMTTVCGTSAYAAPEVGTRSVYTPKVDTWSLGVILFVVLAAYHPFDPFGNKNDIQLRHSVCTYDWDFNDKIWESMSNDVKDLIRKLLCPADERLDADQILTHPWITRFSELPQRNLANFKDRSLRNFVSSTVFTDDNFNVVDQQDSAQNQFAQGADSSGHDDMMVDENDIEPLPFDRNELHAGQMETNGFHVEDPYQQHHQQQQQNALSMQ